jgi:hypothetical protein
LRLMPGNAEWSCFKASLHDHLIFETFLTVIIPLRASYTSILFFFYKKILSRHLTTLHLRQARQSRKAQQPMWVCLWKSALRHKVFCGNDLRSAPLPNSSFANPPRRTDFRARAVRGAPPKCLDLLEYFRPIA